MLFLAIVCRHSCTFAFLPTYPRSKHWVFFITPSNCMAFQRCSRALRLFSVRFFWCVYKSKWSRREESTEASGCHCRLLDCGSKWGLDTAVTDYSFPLIFIQSVARCRPRDCWYETSKTKFLGTSSLWWKILSKTGETCICSKKLQNLELNGQEELFDPSLCMRVSDDYAVLARAFINLYSVSWVGVFLDFFLPQRKAIGRFKAVTSFPESFL